MKNLLLIAAIGMFFGCAKNSCHSSKCSSKPVNLASESDSTAYALGIIYGREFNKTATDITNYDLFVRGIKESTNPNDTSVLSNEVAFDIVRAYMQDSPNRLKQKGKDFLNKNKKRDGVDTTASGLQYEIIKAGDGPKPTLNDKVTVHYEGTLIDGDKFDSSYDRGQPASFGLTQVIKGWTEVLQLMPKGSTWKVYIPYELGYGERGAGRDIPPYATLIFKIELIDF